MRAPHNTRCNCRADPTSVSLEDYLFNAQSCSLTQLFIGNSVYPEESQNPPYTADNGVLDFLALPSMDGEVSAYHAVLPMNLLFVSKESQVIC